MSNSPLVIVCVCIVFCWVLLVLAHTKKKVADDSHPADSGFCATDYSAKPLLSAWELNIFAELRRDMPAGFYACPQARLKDMLDVQAGVGLKSFAPLNRVAAKSVDFAIIDQRGRVALVIELDDKSHDLPERRRRDYEVNAVLRHCRIPLLRLKPGARLNIRAHLSPVLKQVVG